MLNPEDRAKLDQSLACSKEIMPKLWRGLYEGCIQEGFSEEESLELTKVYIISQGQNGGRI